MVRKHLAVAAAAALAMSGCATLRDSPGACKAVTTLAGGALGAVGGGVGVDQIEKGPDDGERAAGAGAGLVAGSLIGFLVGHAICSEPEAPPPPPPVAAPPKGTKIMELNGPNFDFNKATLNAGGRAKVAEAARTLKDNPSVNVSVEGHTDSVGSDAYNQRLSERRAQTVADALKAGGVSSSRITDVKGYGESRPVANNDTEAGRAQNRRVEVIVR
jgi:OOP family OmpA-OmpF porin